MSYIDCNLSGRLLPYFSISPFSHAPKARNIRHVCEVRPATQPRAWRANIAAEFSAITIQSMYQPQRQSASVYLFFFFSPLFVLTASIRNFTWGLVAYIVLYLVPEIPVGPRRASLSRATCEIRLGHCSECGAHLSHAWCRRAIHGSNLPDSVEGYGMGGTGKTSEPGWIGHKPHARMTTSPRYGCFLSYQSVLRLILPQSCS